MQNLNNIQNLNNAKKLKYKNFNSEKEQLQISSKLVSNLLTGWKNPIVITRQVYYEYKSSAKYSGKRPMDQTCSTPDRKRLKLDPRSLFIKE